jgi:hypothetical protein
MVDVIIQSLRKNDNVVYVCSGEVSAVTQDVVKLSLDVLHTSAVTHHCDIELHLPVDRVDGELVAVVFCYEPLVEK